MPTLMQETKKFFVELIKPSHYDDDGYLIQWVRAFIPSNSLASMLALVEDAKERRVLGGDVELVLHGYDECHTHVSVERIIRRIRAGGGKGLVMLVGVQTNQFPRAAEIAREFRAAGIPVAIGGFHVSGCKAMLPRLPADIQAVRDMGVSLFFGEAEGRLGGVIRDAWADRMKPEYDYLKDLPNLQGEVTPYLPRGIARGYMLYTAFDAGRGCPFECSFCTIINVQGRKSRFRSADDVEKIVRAYWDEGIHRFFITDDNFARNRNWEGILDRLIALRDEGIRFKFIIQVDVLCHKIPGFIEKATKAGCNKVFIGLENISPENLKAAKKRQNKISQYKEMLLAWRREGVLTYAGYILGFPADTPESIQRDIRVIQKELPIDILEFMVLTPLPGCEDHRKLLDEGVWMDPDMNKYDLEHVTTRHPGRMTPEELKGIYDRAWHLYYTPEHMKTLIRRGEACGAGARRIAAMVWQYYGCFLIENMHPLQCGILRRKNRRLRRPGFPKESPLVFYPRYVLQMLTKSARGFALWWRLKEVRNQVRSDPEAKNYVDQALSPVDHIEAEREAELNPVGAGVGASD